MDNPQDFTVSAQGVDETDALDHLSGGWFAADNPPPEAVAAANAHGLKVFRFRVTVAGLGEIKAEKCKKCDGCGQVANTEDQEPWTVWLEMPLGSAAAVLVGIVKPIPCPECKGKS